ncbi:MSC_0624 family F1-like ATPase-associated membrane protein [Metamycoplasma equirhinis]|uniref:MSC_0624 family F1-like ATPase-associated membrane protein n=1 Tax=Metamycoplasma equirhinis TaxID=92402 RepID=UPI003593192A
MKNSLNLEETRIFNDYHAFSKNKKGNLDVFIYKIILLTVLVLGCLSVLLFIRDSFFAQKMFANWEIKDFLKFDSNENIQKNTLIFTRFFLLAFVFFYTISKNFMNLYFQKEKIKKYWPWFTLYLSMSIASIVLTFTYFESNPAKSVYLFIILVPVFIINLVYSSYIFNLKRKTDPNSQNNLTSLIITNISQFLLLALVIVGAFSWVFGASSKVANSEMLFKDNTFFNYWKNLLSIKKTKSFFLIFIAATIILSLLFGVNADRISFITFKVKKDEYFKNSIILSLSILTTVIFWLVRIFFIRFDEISVLGKKFQNLIYLVEILFATLVVTGYMLFQFLNRLKTNSHVINTIAISFSEALLWVSLLITTFLSRHNNLVNLINLLFVSLASIAIVGAYYAKTNEYNFGIATFIKLGLISISLTIIIFGLNQILLSENNLTFLIIDSNLEITQIFLVISAIVWTVFLLASTLWLIIVANKITFFKNKHTENEERIKYEEE